MKQLISDAPAHQTFAIGDFVLYSHNYDGDMLQLVKYEHQLEGVPGTQVEATAMPNWTRTCASIPAQALYEALQKLMAERL